MARDLSHLPADLQRRIDNIERGIERSKRDTLRAAGMAAKDVQAGVIRSDAGGDMRLSRVRSGKGATVGVRFDVRGDTVEVRATGPMPLLANPIKPHAIPKSGRRRKVLSIPGIGVRASANHPGTRGKNSWERGRGKAQTVVTRVVGQQTDQAVTRAFRAGG